MSLPLQELVKQCAEREILLLKVTGPIVLPDKIEHILREYADRGSKSDHS